MPDHKTTRISSGIYDVQIGDARFELERYPDGSWLTFTPSTETRCRGYLQDYPTKRAALAGLRFITNQGA